MMQCVERGLEEEKKKRRREEERDEADCCCYGDENVVKRPEYGSESLAYKVCNLEACAIKGWVGWAGWLSWVCAAPLQARAAIPRADMANLQRFCFSDCLSLRQWIFFFQAFGFFPGRAADTDKCQRQTSLMGLLRVLTSAGGC